ncbi:FxSxx-COOH system tetratricopeptide repeat protein [Lentzea sp. BCCO 10_0061]|uniref:FxSxx-COOH system tetratricopeptide repeat protein n=1 Tax=Lentzea sokolovensis TaxID=3095429 RepID=A0ABU4V6C6_9PSEU|nr:FxSxx-COOH system tetratricopeptide repeat protein [Lentzea sp. BCCO 10_0061]MDX8147352.1 FxSxx-COOH system tetratricopeptide repeat protein [Lentzea sp. BCCO 10_0061]
MRTVVAFLSPGAGTGQTGTLANLAVVLAGAGKRVLVLDWVPELPRTSDYLAPFLVDHLSLDDVLGARLVSALAANLGQVPDAEVERYALLDSGGFVDVVKVARVPVPQDGTSPRDLRELLLGTDYDQVLVDAAVSPRRDAAHAVVAELCDAVALCFAPRPGVPERAAELGRAVRRQSSRPVDFIPVATMFDEQYLNQAERALGAIRAAFAELLRDQERRLLPRGVVEIPYRPYDAFRPQLTVLVESPVIESRLLTAYGELAAAVTHDEILAVPAVSPLIASRYRRLYGLDAGAEPPPLVLLHAAPGRAWADWIRGQMEAAGMNVLARPEAGAGTVQVAFVETDGGIDQAVRAALDDLVAAVAERNGSVEVTRLLVTSDLDGTNDVDAITVSLADTTEVRARQRLVAHFGLVDTRGSLAVEGSRFPGSSPRVLVLPQRNSDFVGRDHELEHLRDRFRPGQSAQVQITGPPGIGKSEFAREYAHRFAHDYDLVHWVTAHDQQALADAMGNLTAQVRDVVGIRGGDVLRALATDPANRWLVVYDNADDPDLIDTLPSAVGAGHVVITTTRPHPLAGEELALAELSADESTLLLSRHVPELSAEDAQAAAQAVRHQPLAVELVAAWLGQVVQSAGDPTHAEWAVRELLSRLAEVPLDHDAAVDEQVVGLHVATLRTSALGRVTVLLAEMCAFLSPEGADIRMLRASAVWHALMAAAGDDAALLEGGADELDSVLWMGARYGLLDVDWGRRPLVRMHRVVQAALRDLMPAETRAERRDQVLTALAAYAPSDVDNDHASGVRRYAELQKHVVFSGALQSTAEPVRRWMVSQVRHAYLDGPPARLRVVLDVAQGLIDRWSAEFGEDDGLLLRLRGQIANLHRILGDNHSALALDDAVLARQRRLLSPDHPQALITARGRGGDLRGLGQFAEALLEDQVTYAGLRRSLGDDHPHTRTAANNLALSHYLAGEAEAALRVERDNYQRRLRLFGQNEMQTWWSMCSIGIYLRELGRFQESVEALRSAREHVQLLRPATNPLELRIRWNQAITDRQTGRVPVAADRNRETLADYGERLGPEHPWTLGCRLSLAHDLRRLGDLASAARHAAISLNGFTQEVGLDARHPFVTVCCVAIGRIRLDEGDLGEADALISRGRAEFGSQLGEAHPWTLAARYYAAAVADARGEHDQVRALMTALHEDHVELLGLKHPYTEVTRAYLRDGSWGPLDLDVPQT